MNTKKEIRFIKYKQYFDKGYEEGKTWGMLVMAIPLVLVSVTLIVLLATNTI